MNKRIVFYITGHGYGHASRNVAIIKQLLKSEEDVEIWVKSDGERISFLRRNLSDVGMNIQYASDYYDIGFPLDPHTYEVDTDKLYEQAKYEVKRWKEYIKKESDFLKEKKIEVIVSDVIPWVFYAADFLHIPSILLCNFTWYEMYKDYLPAELSEYYFKAYNLADKILLYDLGNKEILNIYNNVDRLSLISRAVNVENAEKISKKYKHPIFFVSVGQSIVMEQKYDVSQVPGTFIKTQGVGITGKNVVELPPDMIDTQDYIRASDYVISKTGWSSLAEIFLNRKRAAIVARGDNPEDNAVIQEIRDRECAAVIHFDDLKHMDLIIDKMKALKLEKLEWFKDDTERAVSYIMNIQKIAKKQEG